MFLVQEIDLSWHKNERSAAFANVRSQFPQACALEQTLPVEEVVLQRIGFSQRGLAVLTSEQSIRQNLESYLSELGYEREKIRQEIEDRVRSMQAYHVQSYQSVSDLNLANVSVCSCETGFEVSFFYDERRSGLPARRGHNKAYHNLASALYHKDCLNETAFVLAQHQYGRILWNERNIDYDTGQWYYQLHIYNMTVVPDKHLRQDLFTAREPDFLYKQIEELR